MKAIVQERFGPPDTLRLVDIDAPEVGADDVLVRIHAAALNPADWHILRGDPYVARLMGIGLTKPKVPVAGTDAAGVVEAVGANVRGLQPGDEVFGFVRGAFAEYACAAAGQGGAEAGEPDVRAGGRAPHRGDDRPARDPRRGRGEGRTAGARQRGERRGGLVRRADRGGDGRRGHRACAARATSSWCARSAPRTSSTTRTRTSPTGEIKYDVILDNVSSLPLTRLRGALTTKGTLVLNGGGTPGHVFGPIGTLLKAVVVNLFVSQRLRPLPSKTDRQELLDVTGLIEDGKLTPVVDRTYPLADTAEGLRYVEQGHARGKAVVTIA